MSESHPLRGMTREQKSSDEVAARVAAVEADLKARLGFVAEVYVDDMDDARRNGLAEGMTGFWFQVHHHPGYKHRPLEAFDDWNLLHRPQYWPTPEGAAAGYMESLRLWHAAGRPDPNAAYR